MSIFTVYFNRLFKRIENSLDIKFYKSRLSSFKSLLGTGSKGNLLDYYEEYYKNKYSEIKAKEAEIKRREAVALIRVSDNIFSRMLNKARSTIFKFLNR